MPNEITTKLELPASIPDDLMTDLDYQAESEMSKLPLKDGAVDYQRIAPIRLHVKYPLSYKQVKEISRLFTANYDVPFLVIPKDVPIKHADLKEGPMTGEYRTFEGHVTLVKVDGDKKTLFELGTVFEKMILVDPKDRTGPKVHDSYYIIFPGDTSPTKGLYKPELSFPLSKHCYTMQHPDMNITAFSDKALEVGQIYRIGGLMWRAQNKKNTSGVPFQDAFMLVDWAVPVKDILDINQSFFDKFRGLTHDEIRDAVAFPFENSISDYKELPFLAVFNVRAGTIPLNILLMGYPGCTKSGFLKRMASISKDKFVDGASATLKGIMPSFSPRAMTAGTLATSKNFAIVNEFLNIVKKSADVGKFDTSYNSLSTMKQILEGELTEVPSGIGSMSIRMRGSAFFASNWAEANSGRMTTVNSMYEHMESAFLDRLLIYPIRQELQIALVDAHTSRVKELMKQYQKKSGVTDEIEIVEKMPTPYKLNTYDFRTLLAFKEGLVTKLPQDSLNALDEALLTIRQKASYYRFTRARDIITNIASAYAFERMLVAGEVNAETNEILILKEEVKRASDYFTTLLRFYAGVKENDSITRAEWAKHSATASQKFILSMLEKNYLGKEPKERRMLVDYVRSEFVSKYPEMDWYSMVKPLISKGLITWNGLSLMWVPPELEDSLRRKLFVGESRTLKDDEQDRLYRIDGELEATWLIDLPVAPTEQVQNLVRESLKVETNYVPLVEIVKRMQAERAEVVENAVRYMHLYGELWGSEKGYLLAANPEKR